MVSDLATNDGSVDLVDAVMPSHLFESDAGGCQQLGRTAPGYNLVSQTYRAERTDAGES